MTTSDQPPRVPSPAAADYGSRLLPHHQEILRASAIDVEVARERGYVSATEKTRLKAAGFGSAQQRVPALLIPIHGVAGGVVTHQVRPDVPWNNSKGKAVRYKTPAGAHLKLDVHPRTLPVLDDPGVPIVITEGSRKVDAAVSVGIACIGLLGVTAWRGTNDHGGKAALSCWESVAMNGRTIYIAFDSDVVTKVEVRRQLVRLQQFLSGKGAKVGIIYFPTGPGGDKVGLDDYLADGGTVESLFELATDEVLKPELPAREAGARPRVVVGSDHPRETVAAYEDALLAANEPPRNFVRGGRLARFKYDEARRPIVEDLTDVALQLRLSRVTDTMRGAGDLLVPASPPMEAVRQILADDETHAALPALDGIVEVPTLRPDGTVLEIPGYDPATRLIYVPAPDLVCHRVPVDPSPGELAGAVATVLEPFADFPFDGDADRANTIAAALTPIMRPAINGPTPFALFDAPEMGSGKGLCADVVGIIVTGRNLPPQPMSSHEEEVRKMILSTLSEGPAVVLIDNVNSVIRSSALALLATSDVYADRVLGVSVRRTLPARALWIFTGNNIAVGGDIGRRCFRIRLDAKQARPYDRTGFKIPLLRQWVRDNRGRLVSALLVMGRAWYAAGRPTAEVPAFGSYESWAAVIGGTLAHAGVPGFLENLGEFRDEIDLDTADWEAFLLAWLERWSVEEVTVSTVAQEIRDSTTLRDVLPEELANVVEAQRFNTVLGKALRSREDRRHGDSEVRVHRARDTHRKVNRWKVVKSDTDVRGVRGCAEVISVLPPTPNEEGTEEGPSSDLRSGEHGSDPRTPPHPPHIQPAPDAQRSGNGSPPTVAGTRHLELIASSAKPTSKPQPEPTSTPPEPKDEELW